MRGKKNTVDDLWAGIDVRGKDECWPWMRGTDKAGYGRVRFRGRTQRAHRVAYESIHGWGSLDGAFGLHTCDNPTCCNPSHVYRGDHVDNMRDKVRRNRSADLRGENNNNAKLTWELVSAIRARLASGERGVDIARDVGVSTPTISDIKSEKTWRTVT